MEECGEKAQLEGLKGQGMRRLAPQKLTIKNNKIIQGHIGLLHQVSSPDSRIAQKCDLLRALSYPNSHCGTEPLNDPALLSVTSFHVSTNRPLPFVNGKAGATKSCVLCLS